MNRKMTNCLVKKLTAGVVAVSMLLAGVIVMPNEVKAASVVPTEIDYDSTNYDIKLYWNDKKAPVKEGYVFGGWYKGENEEDFMTAKEAQQAVNGTFEGTVYAKFVPASVLSVKTQNETKVGEDDSVTQTHVRVISSLDCKYYEKVGFDIYLGNVSKVYKNDVEGEACETTTIYSGLMENGQEKTANQVFGGVSKYVSVWLLQNVVSEHWNKIIYVRPYWVTMDGTTVYGLAKYAHVEDQYKEYISVPVNLGTGEMVAAGSVDMAYDKELTFVGFEAGRLLPDMKCIHDEANNTIKMIGSAKTENVGTDVSADGIFANLRFAKPTDNTLFDMTTGLFCDWEENRYEADVVKAWDIKYEK